MRMINILTDQGARPNSISGQNGERFKVRVNDYETYVCSNVEFNEKAIADLLLPKIQEKNESGRNQ